MAQQQYYGTGRRKSSAARVFLTRGTGKKLLDKKYYYHTGFIGGIKETSYEKMVERAPTRALEIAVKGMLPKNPLGRAMFRKLKVYAGGEHTHQAQQPKTLAL